MWMERWWMSWDKLHNQLNNKRPSSGQLAHIQVHYVGGTNFLHQFKAYLYQNLLKIFAYFRSTLAFPANAKAYEKPSDKQIRKSIRLKERKEYKKQRGKNMLKDFSHLNARVDFESIWDDFCLLRYRVNKTKSTYK